jgi:UDP-N-acetylglucosamine:LPS N-acetylglucosamine transferase
MKNEKHLLVVVGEGGHSTQCLRLVDLLGPERYRFSYVLEDEDKLSEQQIRVPGPVFRVIRPSCVSKRKILPDALKFARCSLQAAAIVLRLRPDAVVSVGPAVAVPVSLVAKLAGAKVIYLESASRTQGLSLTGKLMSRLADLFFVQWEEILPLAPRRAIFAGRLL